MSLNTGPCQVPAIAGFPYRGDNMPGCDDIYAPGRNILRAGTRSRLNVLSCEASIR